MPGSIDDPARLQLLEILRVHKEGRGFKAGGKGFRLVHEDGRRHGRMDRVKMAYNMVKVWQSGNGVENMVWCETDQARWTQYTRSHPPPPPPA